MDSGFHKPTMTYQLWDESVKQGNTELIQPYSLFSVSKMRLHLEKKNFFLGYNYHLIICFEYILHVEFPCHHNNICCWVVFKE